MLEARRLRLLVEVDRRGSFSAAADALHLTQPSVSRHIAALEREAGSRLVDREARPVRLTQAGEILVAHARAILGHLDSAQAELDALAQLEGGRLRLAGFASVNTWLLPEAIRRFARAHPRVELTLAAVGAHDHVAALRDGEVDVAVITEWDDVDASVDLVSLGEDRLHVALPKGHPLASRDELALEDLADEAWIEGAHPDCLGPLEDLARARGLSLRIGFHCSDWTGKQALVAAGVGVTLFPRPAVAGARRGIVLRPLTDPPATRALHAAVPAGYRAPGADRMVELLRAVAGEHPSS